MAWLICERTHERASDAPSCWPHLLLGDRSSYENRREVRYRNMLTLPSDSAFTTMTGATSVTVYQQTGTTVAGASPIASGSTVHAFGLLFFDGGKWKMVASRIGAE